MSEPFNFINQVFLVWTEPDGYDHNYQFYSLRATGCQQPKVEVPKHIVARIKKHASKVHPILVVYGDEIEALLDRMTWCDKVAKLITPNRRFGVYPRDKDSNKPKGNSVKEFVKAVKNGETF